jgi:hypothetical protein
LAVRLQMKLGVVAEPDRASDSPDTVVIVEPTIGAIARSKGHLYLIVTSRVASARAQEATQLAAETIRGEYYYDESAGIRVCIEKAIASANKRLGHQRERLSLQGTNDNGPIGIGIAVVRGNELYVATIGPAEAYLIRQARLSTLPDPHRERGLPTRELEPDVWRGEISVGDSLVLISPNVMTRLGPDELKDAMVTLHPQPAMEHLHHRFLAADGSGSDAMIAFEATEVASTQRSRTLVPVRPAEPLAGAPDRSPIPLADNVSGGVAAVQASAARARTAAGGLFSGLLGRIQELMPRRRTAYRRVTPAAAKREMQRRAAVAVLAFVVVFGGLVGAVYTLGGQGGPGTGPLSSITAAEGALKTIRANLSQVFAPGVDLVEGDPAKAMSLLTAAYRAVEDATTANVPPATLDPLRTQVVNGLDRLFRVVPVGATTIVAFQSAKVTFDFQSMVLGPDGMPYVLDKATATVYRVDLQTKKALAVYRAKNHVPGGIEGNPRLVTTGARDLLVVDDKSQVWRWRAKDTKGNGTTTKVIVAGAAGWGDDIVAVATFVKLVSEGLYNLYLIDPSKQNIEYYTAARDGTGFPVNEQDWLTVDRDVSKMTDIVIDGDLYVADNGAIARYVGGSGTSWAAQPPGYTGETPDGDTLLRPAPVYVRIATATKKGSGLLYAWDRANARIVAFDKAKGTFVEQYRLAGGSPAWQDVRGMYVVPGVAADAPATLVWATKDTVYSSLLEAVPDGSSASPAPSGSGATGSPGPAASGSGSAAPRASASPKR